MLGVLSFEIQLFLNNCYMSQKNTLPKYRLNNVIY